MKSERLKKLESELADLIKWKELGLVPKQEKERHQEEIKNLKARIIEEKERLQFLKEGEVEEFTAPRRTPAKTVYPETPSMSDVDYRDNNTESGIETESMDLQTTEEDKEEKSAATEVERVEEDEEDPFSDKNRWRRGGIIDPDATEW